MTITLTKQLTDKLNTSIHSYFSTRIKKEDIANLQGNHRSLYFSWYLEWMKHISSTKHLLWYEIRKQKNNLVFINSVFVEFDYVLQKIHPFENHVEPPTVKLNSYLEYANEVYVEAFGKTLPVKNYEKAELLVIIKDCEKLLQSQFLNQTKPSHNVRPLRV